MAIETSAAVAGRVRAFAAERRVSQTDLADALGMSKMAISRRFNGVVPFAVDELGQVAGFFDIPILALLSPSTPIALAVDSSPHTSAVGASSGSGAA